MDSAGVLILFDILLPLSVFVKYFELTTFITRTNTVLQQSIPNICYCTKRTKRINKICETSFQIC